MLPVSIWNHFQTVFQAKVNKNEPHQDQQSYEFEVKHRKGVHRNDSLMRKPCKFYEHQEDKNGTLLQVVTTQDIDKTQTQLTR